MALARQAQRCAVGKLDCGCGCRYCGDHDGANDVQVRRAYERKLRVKFLDPHPSLAVSKIQEGWRGARGVTYLY